jgi:hypothetical protein
MVPLLAQAEPVSQVTWLCQESRFGRQIDRSQFLRLLMQQT